MTTITPHTRDRLLDSAERLFAENGVDATSLRHITNDAEANLASVNYHFGSKEELFRQIFARRIGPINQERLRLLDSCEAQGTPSLECVLEAFLAPTLRLRSDPEQGGEHFMCLMGRLFSEPTEWKTILMEEFNEIFQRFGTALQMALPEHAPIDLTWHLFFTIGAMAHLMTAGDLLKTFTQDRCDPADVEGTLQRLVDFSAAGFRGASRGESP